MRLLGSLSSLLRRLAGRDRFESDMADELAFHVDAHAADLEANGVARPEALRQARLKFGSQERYKQEGREVSRYRMFDELHADMRDAVRGLKRDRGFAVVAVSVIASVLAVNMVLFAFLDAYFVRPLPIQGASRHVELSAREENGRYQRNWPLAEAMRIVASDNPVIEQGYAFAARRVIVGGREPRKAYAEVVSPSFFDLVKPSLAMGQPLSAVQSSLVEPAVMLSHTGWKHLLDGDPDAVGRTLIVDGVPLTVKGVLREGAGALEPVTPEFWMIAGATDATTPGRAPEYMIAGLLREGVSAAQAQSALFPLMKSINDRGPSGTPLREALVEPRPTLLRESRDLEPLAVSLLFLFGLVTAIAAANLTSLHLARAMARRHDLSIRAALGASRNRLVRHLLTEGILVALVGVVIAWGLAVASVSAVQGVVFSIVSDAGMSMLPVRVDSRIVFLAFSLALAIGLGCGLLPALQTARKNSPVVSKRDGAWLGGAVSAGRLRAALVVLQVALSLPLLVSAGVLVKSADQASRAEVGYKLDGLLDLRASPATPRLLDRLRAIPGVLSVSALAQTPLGGDMSRVAVRYDGSEAILQTNEVDERYFETLGMALREGRLFFPHEAESHAPVAVISEATARRLWPGRSALGRTLDIEDGEIAGNYKRHEVVGVVADVMSGFFFRGLDPSAVYRPGGLMEGRATDILVRVNDDNALMATTLRTACVDTQSFCEPFALRRMLGQQRVPFVVASLIGSGLGLLALGLACLGLHGLVRFAVVQRTREFGVRLAIGATRSQILFNVLAESVRRVGWGIGLGLPACLALSALIASRVKILDSFDPISYSLVPLLLLSAAIVASFFPALRAAGTDPIKALRDE